MMSNQKTMHNYQSDLTYIETFGKSDINGNFTPIAIPDDIDFEVELWANESAGAVFKASRIGGKYKFCAKVDASRIRIYIPLSGCSLGMGDLCRNLRIKFPNEGWNGSPSEICVPKKTDYYLWDGPSDEPAITTEIQEDFAAAFKGQDGISAYYHIHTQKRQQISGIINLHTCIEGVSNEDLIRLSDSDKFRLCLMRFRKDEQGGRKWHISALPYFRAARTGTVINPVEHAISEDHTWWPVSGQIVPWFRGANIFDILPYGINQARKRFKNSRNIQMLDGVALFQQTGRGGEGWMRISNISYIQSYLCNRNKAGKEPRVIISVKM